MNVMHLLSTNKLSGAEKVANMINDEISGEFNSYYCSVDGPIRRNVENFIPIDNLSLREVSKVCALNNIDIIHAHDVKASIIAVLVKCKIKKLRVISHLHGNDVRMRKISLKSLIYQFFMNRIDKIICVSKDTFSDYYFHKSSKFREKSILLENVIEEFDVDLIPISTRKFDVVFFGRLDYPKNPEMFIEILEKFRNTYGYELKAAIVGNGPKYFELKQMINDKKLVNVEMLGYLENPERIIRHSKLYLLTSEYEGLPLALLETMSLGVIPITTNLQGVNSVLVNKENGFIIKDNHINNFTQIINKIVNDKQELEKTSNKAIESFNNYNNKNEYMDTIESIYQSQII